MSKYSHYEMCEKIFGQRYKWNEQKQDYELYSRTDMWNKLIEQQDKIADLELKLAESEKFMKDNGFENLEELDNYIQKIHLHYDEIKNKGTCGLCEKIDNEQIKELKQQLAESEKEHELLIDQFEEETEKLRKQIQQESDARKRFVEEVKNLKQQLAERDKAIENLRIDLKDWQDLEEKLATKYDKVVEQLAEKEKEIEKQQLMLDKVITELHTNCYSGLNIVHFKEMMLNDLGGIIITNNQDKISFALEQLEKVLVLIHNAVNIYSPEYDLVGLYDAVSNQIKQLKEKK